MPPPPDLAAADPAHAAANQAAAAFIARWQGVQASELATAQSFVIDLCRLLGVAAPHPTPEQDYMFERPITFAHGDGSTSAGRIDCYRRGAFVLEAKKLKAAGHTRSFDDGLIRARSQAEGYARALPAAETRPPFLLVVDVGTVIEVYAEFSQSGATYTPFPDPRSHRIALADLARPDIRARLAAIWRDPHSLDPARISARVTREVSALLAELARSLEASPGFKPNQAAAPAHQAPAASEVVANYLTRCLFSMFAEDVELLPKGAFTQLLQTHRHDPETLRQMLRILWADMDHGGFSAALAGRVLHFNGKLFKGAQDEGYSLLLTRAQIELLIAAARCNWREVEPAIFGTLLERALDPAERHALGAHYTPRAYVERLVLPTVIQPLRAEWQDAHAAALVLAAEAHQLTGRAADEKMAAARQQVRAFHHRLCSLRVLDPACGSANFLYVTLEHLKRLEGEVLNTLADLGQTQDALAFEGETVTLQQLRGIELNERAAALAELVLWIGWLQWHVRTHGLASVAEPVVHNYGNIECRDAVLAWDAQEPARDAAGRLLSRWDGVTHKPHPVTGQPVPDEAAQVPQWRYLGARKAAWPPADFIVGNPPFIGKQRMGDTLGEGYVQALRTAWPEVPESCDFVMHWWQHAAAQVAAGAAQRMGLITTNSLAMIFNRRVVQAALDSGIHLEMAIADHPWVDGSGNAAVRIAMTVLAKGSGEGDLLTVTDEVPGEHGEQAVSFTEQVGLIHADLSIGANVAAASKLIANRGISFMGMIPLGAGFWVTEDEAVQLGYRSVPGFDKHVKRYLNGKDLMDRPRGILALDFFGLSSEELRQQFPAAYQWLKERVKPQRDQDKRASRRNNWWLWGESVPKFRVAVEGLQRYIGTAETAKHRVFSFIDGDVFPDQKVRAVVHDSAYVLGVLSSQLHVDWALATGGTLEDRPVYNTSRCFETFPFPDTDTGLTPALRQRIAQLAEQIDAHRKRVLGHDTFPLWGKAGMGAGGTSADVEPAPAAPTPTLPQRGREQQPGREKLTLTGLYNVLAALREDRALTAKEKAIHTQGLVGVLRELHDELDAAVRAAYGLPPAADTEAVLARLVQLNAQRAQEEAAGHVRWLRPAFQNPEKSLSKQELIALDHQAPEADSSTEKSLSKSEQFAPQPWPSALPDQVRAVAAVLAQAKAPLPLPAIEAHFKGRGPWKKSLPTLLATLEALGRAQAVAVDGEAGWRG
ncbi:MAG: class I SAM-dependent DNA methyltransferase [Proteobacteria bacterium]|nr:class I SAM-dependent DNA methyltransferase [Pseudomonadota bacterium]